MPWDASSDLASTLVAVAPSPPSSGLSLTVTAGAGAVFPAPPFDVLIQDAAVWPTRTTAELARVQSISTDTLTLGHGISRLPRHVGPHGPCRGSYLCGVHGGAVAGGPSGDRREHDGAGGQGAPRVSGSDGLTDGPEPVARRQHDEDREHGVRAGQRWRWRRCGHPGVCESPGRHNDAPHERQPDGRRRAHARG